MAALSDIEGGNAKMYQIHYSKNLGSELTKIQGIDGYYVGNNSPLLFKRKAEGVKYPR